MTHRYSLDKTSKKFKCPKCDKKRLVRYYDSVNKIYMKEFVGRCDREDSCAYHFTPKMFFDMYPLVDNLITNGVIQSATQNKLLERPTDKIHFIEKRILKDSMHGFAQNNFVIWLSTLFNQEIVNELITTYNIGTSRRWPGATVFFQQDINLNIRQAKVMLYNSQTGRRIKNHEEPYPGKSKIFFAGKNLLKKTGIKEPNLKQCFFGEHLLNEYNKIVGLVESEKTAIILHGYSLADLAPKYIWLATGGKNGCRWYGDASLVLEGRDVILFPDLGAFDEWKNKSKKVSNCHLIVSNILEEEATEEERNAGLDLADFYDKLKLQKQSKQNLPQKKETTSSYQLAIEVLAKKNPHIQDLIDRFQLVSDRSLS